MDIELIYKVRNNEESLMELLSKYEKVKGQYIRYYDDSLKDMYDHNFYVPLTNVDESFINKLENLKQEYGNTHIKVTSDEKEEIFLKYGFEEEALLIMLNSKMNLEIPNKELVFKNLQDDDIKEELRHIEIKHYGNVYGMDFTNRKMTRYLDEYQRSKNLNFFAAFLNNEIVASCYTYFHDGVVALDGLVTDIDHRHKKIATSLLGYVQKYYNCPVYLHADNDETPKEMYKALGFEEIYQTFSYLKVDKKA